MIDDSTFEDDDKASAASSDDKQNASDLDRDQLFRRLKRWFLMDKRHSEDWRRQAENEFDFVAGRQWSAEDMATLREQMRPVVAFNRIAPVISAVSGTEVTNRQEVRYLPREPGDAAADEILTATAKWFRDECNGEDEESDAFWDCLCCGMGWTETRFDFESDADGAPVLERVDPLEMFWDAAAKKRNIEDARRIWRVKKVPLDEAEALVGADPDTPDEDFDAKWANFDSKGDPNETRQEARFYRPTKGGNNDSDTDLITLVECQWWERETIYAVAGPMGTEFLTEDQIETVLARFVELGQEPPRMARQTRRKYFRAWLGQKVLAEPEKAPYGDHFSYNAITGYRDRNKGTYYGLVRSMLDPQAWANKWLSQTMHILNTSAKGGALVEKGAFEDEREAEKTWARPDNFVYMKQGALSNANGAKIIPKPQPTMPVGYPDLMQFALQSIRDASGVNLELLGQKDTEQPGVLEAQRKRQAMAVLAVLFDSLRRYRKTQGKLLLWLIQEFVSDGRLIRITGNNGAAQYMPFIRQPDFKTYDVIVDDAPSSPQQKEITWALLMQTIPMLKGMITPDMFASFMKYSPLPASAVQELQQVITQSQQQNAQQQAEVAQVSKAGAVAKVQETASKAALNQAKAAREGMAAQREAMPPLMVQPNVLPTEGDMPPFEGMA